MPAWLIGLLTGLFEVIVKLLKVSRRDLVIALITLILCGVSVVVLAQTVVVPFVGRLDTIQAQIDTLQRRDSAFQRMDSTLLIQLTQMGKSTNTNLIMQLLDSPFLSGEEKAQITARMVFGEILSGDSLAKVVAVRKNERFLRDRP